MKEYELELIAISNNAEKTIGADLVHKIRDLSYFDLVVLSEWTEAMKNGLFKFKIESPLPTKYLSGKYSFLVQFNPKRYTEKRPSQINQTFKLNQEFDKSQFNFTRIDEKEVLFQVKLERSRLQLISTRGYTEKQYMIRPLSEIGCSDNHHEANYIIINNSPIEFGHSLIVPRLSACQNQVINVEAIELASRLSLLSSSTHLLIGFNSINAYASVNHLHMHVYYINDDKKFPFPIQNVTQAELVAKNLWFISEHSYYMPAFSLQLNDFDNDFHEFSRHVYIVTDYMSKNNIPHNLALVKAGSFESSSTATNGVTLRAVIWPRKSSYEIPLNAISITFALCELSGHFFILDKKHFENMTECEILDLAAHVKFNQCRLDRIKEEIKNRFTRV